MDFCRGKSNIFGKRGFAVAPGTFAALTIGLALVLTGRWGIMAAARIVTVSDFAVLSSRPSPFAASRPFTILWRLRQLLCHWRVLAVWVVLREPAAGHLVSRLRCFVVATVVVTVFGYGRSAPVDRVGE